MTAKKRTRVGAGLGAVLLLMSGVALAEPTHADKDDPKVRFQHGVDLFRDGDFRAAVIEFKRAYELSPNPRVLYSLGEASLEAQDYPGAQAALRRYLDEVGKDVPPARRAQVELDLRKLEARIAKVTIRTNIDGAEVVVDDIPAGRSPLSSPLIVGAGRRRILVAAAGAQQSRIVDLAGGDNVALEFVFATPADPPASGADPLGIDSSSTASEGARAPHLEQPPRAALPPPSRVSHGGLSSWQTAGVISTSILAAGTAVVGVLTLVAKHDFDGKLANHPSTKFEIDNARTTTRSLALATDITGGAALLTGAATLLSVVLIGGSHGGDRSKVGLLIEPSGVDLFAKF